MDLGDSVKTHENGERYMEMEIEGVTHNVFFNDSAKRLEYEDFDAYKIRRKMDKLALLSKLKGDTVWASAFQGSFKKDVHEEIMNAKNIMNKINKEDGE